MECPYCGWDLDKSAYRRHVPVCKLNPGPEKLVHDWTVIGSIRGMARAYNVGVNTMRRWLVDAGVTFNNGTNRAKAQPEADAELLTGVALVKPNSCKRCFAKSACQDVFRAIGWVLCENPTRDDMQVQWQGLDLREIGLHALRKHGLKGELK